MKKRMLNHAMLGVLVAVVATGCQTADLVDNPSQTLSGSIIQGDTTLLLGESVTVGSIAEYIFGPGVPLGVVWAADDPAVLAVTALALGEVQITAQAVGSSLLVARIDDLFLDTITVTVVDSGTVLWRRTLAAGSMGAEVAIADSGAVVAVDGTGAIVMFGPTGDTVRRTLGGCQTRWSAANSLDGVYLAGNGCVTRFSRDGVQVWSDSVGSVDEGFAIASDGSMITTAFHDGALTVSRYTSVGGLTWRDTLWAGPTALASRSGVALAANGDVYVPWRSAPDSAWLTRITSAGLVRWTIVLPGWAQLTTPAVVGTRVYVVHKSGVSARDSTGQFVYERPFSDVFLGGATQQQASSPTLDASGNLYVMAEAGLFSLNPSGQVRWVADSVRGGNPAGVMPTPTLVSGNLMVTWCGTSVCGVSTADGVPTWRSPALLPAGAMRYGSLVPGAAGILFAQIDDEVVALWHRRPANSGWATRGGDIGRSGRALQ